MVDFYKNGENADLAIHHIQRVIQFALYWLRLTQSECPAHSRLRHPCTFRVSPRAFLNFFVVVSFRHTPTQLSIIYTRAFYTPSHQLHLNRSYYNNLACEPRGGTHKATFPFNHTSCHSDAHSTATHTILLPCTLALKTVCSFHLNKTITIMCFDQRHTICG